LFIETRNTNSSSWTNAWGITAWGGIICPGFSRVTLSGGSISDGTSNTMMISEQSDYLFYSNGQKGGDYDMTTTANGLFRGHSAGGRNGNALGAMHAWDDARGQTFTTVRFSVNRKRGWTKADSTVPCPQALPATSNSPCGVSPSSWQSEGSNVPLVSPHPGGVNTLVGDGSVRFLNDSTSLLVLARFATRDDGGVFTLP
jgi:hypothetical protein